MRVLLVSTYELGHQPLHLASAAAALTEAGHDVRCLDVSVDPWDPEAVEGIDAVAFSVPMHTATRLALQGAEAVKRRRPGLPVCFYGLYATAGHQLADHVVAGEYERGLVDWVAGLSSGSGQVGSLVDLGRQPARLPVRSGLPPLERYARMDDGRSEVLAGYVEASHGCAYRCRHCPVPAVYDGRTRKVDTDVVLADVAALVEAGARHITFGDPDFLNRWAHAMQVVTELHERFGDLTYDITTKVEHVLRYRHLLGDLAETGCLFAVSAFECVNDDVLRYLDKGHVAAEAAEATRLLRAHGIEVRPSWLPFTPWTTVDDVADILDFVVDNDLVGNVDPVQYTIKLLVPQGSLMLEVPEMQPFLGPFDDEHLTYAWRAADERTVRLQREIAALVERRQDEDAPTTEIFSDIREHVARAAGRPPASGPVTARRVPRLTEPWFCCAEPTDMQLDFVTTGGKT